MALYKNWPEICQIGRKHQLLMLILASIEIDESDPVFQGLYVGFSSCFSEEKTDGPFPLSIIRELARESAASKGYFGKDAADYPNTWGVLDDFDVPYIIFEVCEPGDGETSWPTFPPSAIEKTAKQCQTFLWKGRQMVLLENNYNDRTNDWRIVLAPIECIALDQ